MIILRVVADFHIHSKYAAATSKNSDLEGLSTWAKLKGITLQGTGDYTHPKWFKELKEKLKPAEQGLYQYNNQRFLLSVEVSLVFEFEGKKRKVHVIILTPTLEQAEQINEELMKHGKILYDGRPTLDLNGEALIELVEQFGNDNEFIPAHVWTPWFSVFGSKFGVDSVEQAFANKSDKIIALETGLSSDPKMNWMISKNSKYALVSNSDSHSPQKLGREANVFELDQVNYNSVMNSLRTRNGFIKTYEFFPQEGKYHHDGHRKCNFTCDPEKSKELKNKCPVCKKSMTLGVLHRVYDLADKPYGYKPENAVDFQHIIPLPQIISKILQKPETSKKVWEMYDKLIRYFGSEFQVFESQYGELVLASNKDLADALFKVNQGNVQWKPGYDGVFGEFALDKEELKQQETPQRTLGEF